MPGFDRPPAYADQGHQPYQDPHPYQQASDYPAERPSFDPPPSFLTADRQTFSQEPFAQELFAQQPFAQPSPPVYPTAPEVGAMPAPHGDEFYDDAPRGGRRKGLLTVAAVLALAVVGTASAVGYRNFFSGPGVSAPPPVIRASSEPAKVAPPQSGAVAADPSASKFNYDRFADRGKDEQVVPRQETPIDQRELAKSTAPPRTVLPGAPIANSPSNRTGATNAANPPSAIGEPRRVRTVPIKPDANDMAANVPGASTDQLPPPPSPSSRQASAVPAPSRSVETRPAEPPARAAPPQQQPRTVTASRNTPAPSANAPLSLSPEAANSAPPPPAAVRDIAPPAASPPPSRQATASAAAPRASAGGRFHVQVSSQKSEADAEQSYRSIASRHSGVLGGQPHVVRRADLGSKGVFYRAMVGPFGSREEAVQLCSSLKSAGGDCVVQAN